MTERFHVFLNKSLTIFCSERESTRTATGAIQLCCYGWNSIPVVGTDISQSLLVVGREFKLPIEYTKSKYTPIHTSTIELQKYSEMQEIILSQSREIFRILIQKHRAMHRKYINARRPDPLIYQIRDLVFARRTVQSNRQKGRVGKVTIKHTGPWKITESLPGGSYQLQHLKSGYNDKNIHIPALSLSRTTHPISSLVRARPQL
jgi:hypothetical protein